MLKPKNSLYRVGMKMSALEDWHTVGYKGEILNVKSAYVEGYWFELTLFSSCSGLKSIDIAI